MRALHFLGAAAIVAGCARQGPVPGGTSRPSLEGRTLEIASLDFDEADGELHLDVFNPTGTTLELERVDWTLTLAGEDTVQGRTYGGTLADEPVSDLSVRVRFPWSAVSDALAADPDRAYLGYRIDGEALLVTPEGLERLPFTANGSVPVLRPPEVDIAQLRMRSLDLADDTATVDLVLEMTGPIRALDEMTLGLALDGVEMGSTRRARSYDEVDRLLVPLRLDLDAIRPSTLRALQSEGTVRAELTLRGIAETAHGAVPLELRVSDTVPVVGEPVL